MTGPSMGKVAMFIGYVVPTTVVRVGVLTSAA